MDAERLFSLGNLAVLPGWLVLVFLPRWKWGAAFLVGGLIPLLLGTCYVFLFFPNFGSADGGFGSIDEVRELFANDAILTAGWLHYLAFDLFIGAWIVRDARPRGIPHLAVVPCLPLTFMFGPTGLVAYLVLRWGWKRDLLLGTEPNLAASA
ncbi:MAG: ABA4-like family protein [Longimicrobiales bacterium]